MIFAAGFVAYAAWVARAARTAPVVDENERPIRVVGFDDVLITPQGVEIPIAWLANGDDLDEVLETLREIDRMGAAA